jgi:hypothetical protein
MMINKQHQSSTLKITIAAVVIASVLALSVVVFVTQEANATGSTKVSLKQTQVNKCSGSAECSHTATIIFRLPGGGGHGGSQSPLIYSL